MQPTCHCEFSDGYIYSHWEDLGKSILTNDIDSTPSFCVILTSFMFACPKPEARLRAILNSQSAKKPSASLFDEVVLP